VCSQSYETLGFKPQKIATIPKSAIIRKSDAESPDPRYAEPPLIRKRVRRQASLERLEKSKWKRKDFGSGDLSDLDSQCSLTSADYVPIQYELSSIPNKFKNTWINPVTTPNSEKSVRRKSLKIKALN